MKVVVITGSTRGIGYGLADAFLNLDCAVTISGRGGSSLDEARNNLLANHPDARLLSLPCDVQDYQQVQLLWDKSYDRFGRIDIWINNAGISQPLLDIYQLPPDKMEAIVHTNLLGTLYGCRVALQGMLEQGSGAIYNLEGMGSNGRKQRGVNLYCTTKAAIRYLNEALVMETGDLPVVVGAIAPGMVITDMITQPYEDLPEQWEKDKRIFNILGDRVDAVAPRLAVEILNNDKHGATIGRNRSWLVFLRFLTAPFTKRQVID